MHSAWWNNLSLRAKGLVVIAIPLTALLVENVLFSIQKRTDDAADIAITRTLEVKEQARTLLTLLVDSETGMRGFLLTADKAFLEPRTRAVQELPANPRTLAGIGRGRPLAEFVHRARDPSAVGVAPRAGR